METTLFSYAWENDGGSCFAIVVPRIYTVTDPGYRLLNASIEKGCYVVKTLPLEGDASKVVLIVHRSQEAGLIATV
jgi:hypothetical protein